MRVKNPIIPGFHPDPSIIYVDGVYYIANSTFEWFPGIQLHASTDLKHWYLKGYVLTESRLAELRGVPNSGGVWAPCLSYDGEYFYVIFSITRTFEEMVQDTDNYLIRAKSLDGPWSEPMYLNSGGFDASLFHDEDGRKWLVNMRWDNRLGVNHFPGIVLQEVDVENRRMKGAPRLIFKGTSIGLTEGPHLYKKNGYYYLMTAEGGTSEGHSVTMARSTQIEGPYEADPENPVLTSSDNPEHPIQYAGHGDLIEDEEGNWYLVHLGSRKALFHNQSVFGRETFLQKVIWTEDGWLRLADGGHWPKEELELPEKEDKLQGKGIPAGENFFHKYTFEKQEPDLRFQALRIPFEEKWMSLTQRPGYLRLKGRESLLSHHEQSLVAVRIEDTDFAAEICMEFKPEHQWHSAGLVFFYHTANFYYFHVSADSEGGRWLHLLARDNKKLREPYPDGIRLGDGDCVYLRGCFTPDGLTFFYKEVEDEEWKPYPLAEGEALPVTILSDEYANKCGEQGFTGAFVGMCCQDMTGMGHAADFAYFLIARN